MGRVTYEGFTALWPYQSGDDQEFADYKDNTSKLVVSTTLDTVGWQNSTLIEGNAADEIAKLKRQPGKDISISGRHPRPNAAAKRPDRRVPSHGSSRSRVEREAFLGGRERAEGSETRGCKDPQHAGLLYLTYHPAGE